MVVQGGETYEKWNAYGQSKTANILFSIGLANKYGDRGVLAYSLNPGAIATTNLAGHLDFAPGGDLDSLGEFDCQHQLSTAGFLSLMVRGYVANLSFVFAFLFCSTNHSVDCVAVGLDGKGVAFT
jgi:NAD(P)-dependent dehydrogenase (short-subunit alcohol dehydrogenase family)